MSYSTSWLPCSVPSRATKAEALEIARQHNLEAEVREAMRNGYTPEEALEEWDL